MEPKQNIILLHGALGSKNQFNKLTPLLEETFNVHVLNFEGHGGQRIVRDFSINLFTQNVIEFLNSNAIESTHIFGYSMGGYVALKLALAHPDRVGTIVTLGTKFNWSEKATKKEVGMLDPDLIELKVPHFAKRLGETHGHENWQQVVVQTGKMMQKLSSGEKLTGSELSQISNEVVIGVGTLDNMVTMEESRKVVDYLPNGRLVELEDVKHAVESMMPTSLANYISEALSQ